MKVLVTGGTGFIGSHLVDALVGKGYEVRCLVRRTSDIAHLQQLGVELVYGDVRETESLEGGLKGTDAVYHMAGILGQWGLPNRAYHEVHVNGTKAVLEASLKQNISRVIYCSSASVLGAVSNPPADETWPCLAASAYGKAKTAAERLVLETHAKFGLPVTVVRPEFVYGPRDRHLLSLFRSIKQGWFVIIGNGKAHLHPTFIFDLTSGLLLVLERGSKSIGKTYFIVGERYVTVNELATIVRSALGKKGRTMHVPYSLGWMAATILESSSKVLGFSPPLTKTRLRLFNEDKAFSYRKAAEELGYYPVVTLEEGIAKTIQWYQENGWL